MNAVHLSAAKKEDDSKEQNFMIMGYKVAFSNDKQPFPAQLAVMNRVLLALKTNQHALLESPTGSGKTLAILCSCLSFQKQYTEELLIQKEVQLKENAINKDKNSAQDASVSPLDDRVPFASAEDDEDFESNEPAVVKYGAIRNLDHPFMMCDTSNKQEACTSDLPAKACYQDQYEHSSDSAAIKTRKLPSSFTPASEQQDTDTPSNVTFSPSTIAAVHPPQIFFCSRTHSQLAQSVEEFRKCPSSYFHFLGDYPELESRSQLRSCILASKSQYCINSRAKHSERDDRSVDEKCQNLLSENKCSFYRSGRESNPQSSRVPHIWDIEEFVSLAKRKKECAYYSALNILPLADIVFCPYNYLIHPSVRSAVNISLKDAIVVLDEAHNVEDSCRSSASFEITKETLSVCIQSFTHVIEEAFRPQAYPSLLSILTGFARWMEMVSTTVKLQPTGFEEESNVWSGSDAIAMFDEYAGMNQDNLSSFQSALQLVHEHEKMLMQVEKGSGNDVDHNSAQSKSPEVLLRPIALKTMETILCVASFMFRDEFKYLDDFQLLFFKSRAQKGTKDMSADNRLASRDERGSAKAAGWQFRIAIWCLSGAVVFADIARDARSVILTSGTLTPMDSFAGELGLDFGIRLEANHVVDMRTQVFIRAIMQGPGQVDLSSTYQNQHTFRYQDALGSLLKQYVQVIPGGILMFLPSYRLLGILVNRWKQTGVWDQINAIKKVFTEARTAGIDFDADLEQYKLAIQGQEQSSDGDGSGRRGAIFLAVYRGKVSEGIDFSDGNARAVIAVGIPFPSSKQLQVSLKRQYQDKKCKSERKVLNGQQWYQLQAFRALNQAIGRCIRHRNDYGAIFLLDSRHRMQAFAPSFSKWMRTLIVEQEHTEDCLPELSQFFQYNARVRPCVPVNTVKIAYEPDGVVKPMLKKQKLRERKNWNEATTLTRGEQNKTNTIDLFEMFKRR